MNQKTLFIVGSSGDIGKEIVKKFKENNYKIIAPSSKELNLKNLHEYKSLDFGIKSVDCFIHSAGINNPDNFLNLSEDNFESTLTINTRSFFYLLQKIAPIMIKQNNGSVLAISSIYGTISRNRRTAYSASKHAINGIIKSAAIELGQYNINVNSLSPGFVNTSLTYKNNSKEKIEELKNKISLKRMAVPSDISTIAYFLCNDAKYITGQDIIADGGYTIGSFENEF